MDPFIVLLLVLAVAMAGSAAFIFRARRDRGTAHHRELAEKLDRIQQQVASHLQNSQSLLSERTAAFERTAREMATTFGRLQEAQATLGRTATEILDFQKMLRAPSVRGGFGEVLLEALLAEILPADKYALQYVLSSGERADAVLKLADGHLVAVDAKFPLAAYEDLAAARTDEERAAAERAFASDVRAHAKDISRKYILEADRTLPFAFMYIPAEGIFYEIVRRPALWEEVSRLRVFPTSPNAFIPYMYTVLVGLRGLKVQEEARQILAKLAGFQRDFARVAEEFAKVGTHLSAAQNRHADATRVFERVRSRVEALGSAERAPLGAGEEHPARAPDR